MRAPDPLECVTVDESERRRWQSVQLSATLPCDLHLALVRLKLVQRVVDSYALLNPIREFWFEKGWRNRIRHVDPPIPNLFQLLELTQQARAHDPGPPCRQKMCNCLQMRALGLPECVTVVAFEKVRCQSV